MHTYLLIHTHIYIHTYLNIEHAVMAVVYAQLMAGYTYDAVAAALDIAAGADGRQVYVVVHRALNANRTQDTLPVSAAQRDTEGYAYTQQCTYTDTMVLVFCFRSSWTTLESGGCPSPHNCRSLNNSTESDLFLTT